MDNMILPSLRVLLLFWAYISAVDGLIGLRPANQSPHYVTTTQRPKPVTRNSPKPYNSQLHSPYAVPDDYFNFPVNETELQNTDTCRTLQLLRCSSQLLKQVKLNTSVLCSEIQHFTNCIIESLREHGRREFVTALVVLDDFHQRFKESFRCSENDTKLSLPHLRHELSKRNSERCYTNEILNCAIETFFKMSFNMNEHCDLINFYDVCMNEISKTCRLVSDLYPLYVSQLKRQCHVSGRKKRSPKHNKRHFGLTYNINRFKISNE